MTDALRILASATLLLAGCAADRSAYPSLQPRPAEGLSFAEPVRPQPVARPDPALDARIAALTGTLAKAAQGFETARQAALPIVAAAEGDAAGGDRWIAAQIALATLDDYRAQSSGALDTIEQSVVARAAAFQPAYPSLDAARAAANAQLENQTAEIGRLQAVLLPAG